MYSIAKHILLLSFLFLGLGCQQKPTENPYQTLWYRTPAEQWEDALPLGNGRLGMMVFGHPAADRIQLNDDSLWPEDLGWEHPEGNPEDLLQIRAALDRGDAVTADRLLAIYICNIYRYRLACGISTITDINRN